MKYIKVYLFLIFHSFSYATNWYIDNQATGANDGTSWENAWQSFADINWSLIQPGDTIYISGGTSGKTYNENLIIAASGTNGNPIFIKSGQDIGHTGRVIIKGTVNFGAANWVVLNGNYNNNQNIEITNPTAVGIYSTSPIGIKIQYVEVHDCGDERDEHGIWFNGYNGLPSDAEIAYSYIHDNYQDGINVNRSKGASYGEISIHHNIIERNGDDGIQIAAGADIYNNIIRDRVDTGAPSHADGIQGVGSYFRIYNNEIYDFSNSMIFIETTQESVGHWQIYNNVLYMDDMIPSYTRGIQLKAKGPNTGDTLELVIWDDILVANNTIADFTDYLALYISKANTVITLSITNLTWVNNIIYNCGYSVAVALGDYGSEEDLVFDNNIVFAGDSGSAAISYRGTLYENAEALNNATSFSHNSSAEPVFVNYGGRNFHLSPVDTVAIDKGADLATYFTTDKDGISRPQGSAWDIGAYEYVQTKIREIFHGKRNYKLFIIPNILKNGNLIRYFLPKKSDVKVTLYNVSGQIVKTLVNKKQNAGWHFVTVINKNTPGIYFIRLKTGNLEKICKLLIIKQKNGR